MQEPSVPARELGARAAWSYTRPVAGARKVVTVVFADVAGFNALGEALDPEAVRRVIERYVGEARSVLEQHGGKVEKFIGDAIMAVFGIPLLHDDDALRAVRAATELQVRLAVLNDELERDWGIRIAVRTGINTARSSPGTGAATEAFATGDAVNVAARLEQTAGPGEILTGDTTRRLLREAIRVEAVEPLALRGKAEPEPAWRLLEALPDVPAFTRPIRAPSAARDAQLDKLTVQARLAVGLAGELTTERLRDVLTGLVRRAQGDGHVANGAAKILLDLSRAATEGGEEDGLPMDARWEELTPEQRAVARARADALAQKLALGEGGRSGW
jgi:class 3 adenylate cyclase